VYDVEVLKVCVCVCSYVSVLVCVSCICMCVHACMSVCVSVYVFEVWYHVQFAFIILHVSVVPPPPSVSPSLLIPQAGRMDCV